MNNIYRLIWGFFLYIFKQQTEGVSVIAFLATTTISVIVLNVIFLLYERISEKKLEKRYKRTLFLMAVYACIIFQIAFYRRIGSEKQMINTDLYFGFKNKYGMPDVKQIMYSFLNICFFIPWGFLIAHNMKNGFRKLFMTILYCFLTSFFIETMQYITKTGYFEVSDLVTNVLGGIIGCLFSFIVTAIIEWMRHRKSFGDSYEEY
ncbi:MAG: VanZ family protein [Butyrivibrio sp.]|nr:VanZ family protein [Butyrivibrio sp.]